MNQYPPAVTLAERMTGDVYPMIGLGGPQQKRVWYSIDYWVGVSDHVAVAYVATEGVHIPVSVVIYAPPTTELLRSLSVGALTSADDSWPRWEHAEPPTPDEVRNRWMLEVVAGKGEVKYAPTVEPQLVRRVGQTPDDFYAEVARVYEHLRTLTKRPTTGIAEAGQVPYTTAAKWVREARQRGHLAPSQKGSRDA